VEQDIRSVFIGEAFELLQTAEESLLILENYDNQYQYEEALNNLFRVMHTFKGSSGAVGIDYIQGFTHKFENFLDGVRQAKISLNKEIIELFFKTKDYMLKLVEHLNSGSEDFSAFKADGDSIIDALKSFNNNDGEFREETSDAKQEIKADEEVSFEDWHISLRFKENTFIDGMDPFSFIYYLNKIGSIEYIYTILDRLPDFEELNPEFCYLGFEINFHTEFDREAIINVFEFVMDNLEINILPPKSKIADYAKCIQGLSEDKTRIGEILVACGALTEIELEAMLHIQSNQEKEERKLLGKIVTENNAVDKNVVNEAIKKQEKINDKKNKESKTFRIDADKLDSVINLAGELVTVTTGITELSKIIDDPMLMEYTSALLRLVDDLRDTSIELRMVPVGESFNRMRRIVRDLGKDTGKAIDIEINGAETEFDKTYMEKINDPLIHLIRNSIDHGIEMPDVRTAKGKPERGKITLNAYSDSGSIIIEVGDDGNGLNKEKIIKKAVEKGLIFGEHGNLNDNEIYNLIFEPGFSTAEKVTSISGRGVGMDVVKRNIEELRGVIEIETKESEYTTIRIRLPLTLAIIDGFMVGFDGNRYVIPLEMILECIDFNESTKNNNEVRYINLRGDLLPYVKFSDIFGREDKKTAESNIIIVKYAGQVVGFAVDEIFGEIQTVLKSLGGIYKDAEFFSGATILGDGNIAFVLDMPKLIKYAELKDL
jgi:two-component system chemotaxis sensor kinase CheA